jgi:hypothetical protein
MARRRSVLALIALIVGAAGSAFAQSSETPPPEQTKVEFASYYVVFAERGPNWKPQSDEEGWKVRMEVAESLKKGLKNGQVIIAGVVNDGSGAEFIAIIQTEDEAGMRKMLQESKNVANGFFKLRIHSWFAPAGLKLETTLRK